jgi:hypothetical protein
LLEQLPTRTTEFIYLHAGPTPALIPLNTCERSIQHLAIVSGRRWIRPLLEPSVPCKSKLTVRLLSASHIVELAQSRGLAPGDAELGDFDEEPVVLFRAGRMPAEIDE